MDTIEYNRNAWNLQSDEGCRWSTPFSDDIIEKAKCGDWSVILTPNHSVPKSWFPSGGDLAGVEVLALASGGGQQVPVLAAAGADVTSWDNSDVQLQKDADTCAAHGLKVRTYQGHMGNLAALSDESFDIIFNPVSTVFVEDLDPVWRECARVLRPNGRLMTGFVNPSFYLFDHEALEESGDLRAVHRLPYSDLESLDEETLSAQLEAQVSLEYSHSWEKQIGGQCRAGLAIADLYEDDWDEKSTGLQGVMPLYAATLAMKLDLPI